MGCTISNSNYTQISEINNPKSTLYWLLLEFSFMLGNLKIIQRPNSIIVLLLLLPILAFADQNTSLCSIVASTNVAETYAEWNCSTYGDPFSDPCTWTGLHCLGNNVGSISLDNLGTVLTGK